MGQFLWVILGAELVAIPIIFGLLHLRMKRTRCGRVRADE